MGIRWTAKQYAKIVKEAMDIAIHDRIYVNVEATTEEEFKRLTDIMRKENFKPEESVCHGYIVFKNDDHQPLISQKWVPKK